MLLEEFCTPLKLVSASKIILGKGIQIWFGWAVKCDARASKPLRILRGPLGNNMYSFGIWEILTKYRPIFHDFQVLAWQTPKNIQILEKQTKCLWIFL